MFLLQFSCALRHLSKLELLRKSNLVVAFSDLTIADNILETFKHNLLLFLHLFLIWGVLDLDLPNLGPHYEDYIQLSVPA